MTEEQKDELRTLCAQFWLQACTMGLGFHQAMDMFNEFSDDSLAAGFCVALEAQRNRNANNQAVH